MKSTVILCLVLFFVSGLIGFIFGYIIRDAHHDDKPIEKEKGE